MNKTRKTDQRLAIFFLSLSLLVLYGVVGYACYRWHLLLWSFNEVSPWRVLWLVGLGFLPFIFLIGGTFSFAQGWEGPNPKAFHRVALSLVGFGLLFPVLFYGGEKVALQNESVFSISGWADAEGYSRYLMIPDFEKKVDLTGQDSSLMKAYLSGGYVRLSKQTLAQEENHPYYYYLGYKETDTWLGRGSYLYYQLVFDTQDVFLSRKVITTAHPL